jgi:hypothetical protein
VSCGAPPPPNPTETGPRGCSDSRTDPTRVPSDVFKCVLSTLSVCCRVRVCCAVLLCVLRSGCEGFLLLPFGWRNRSHRQKAKDSGWMVGGAQLLALWPVGHTETRGEGMRK